MIIDNFLPNNPKLHTFLRSKLRKIHEDIFIEFLEKKFYFPRYFYLSRSMSEYKKFINTIPEKSNDLLDFSSIQILYHEYNDEISYVLIKTPIEYIWIQSIYNRHKPFVIRYPDLFQIARSLTTSLPIVRGLFDIQDAMKMDECELFNYIKKVMKKD